MAGRTISLNIPKVPNQGFVVLDTETTGLHDPARVIELALIFMSPAGQIESTWTTLLRGDGHAGGPKLERIHGIRDSDLVQAPTFKQIAEEFKDAVQGRLIFGHNSKFDRARINFELGLIRHSLLPELPCTMYLGMHLGHGQLRLDDAIDLFGINRVNAHCAYDDALATAELLKHYMISDRRGVDSYLRNKGFR
jgi:DNA polymerase-3 subunit epsilon